MTPRQKEWIRIERLLEKIFRQDRHRAVTNLYRQRRRDEK